MTDPAQLVAVRNLTVDFLASDTPGVRLRDST
jgi:hypothetical protein